MRLAYAHVWVSVVLRVNVCFMNIKCFGMCIYVYDIALMKKAVLLMQEYFYLDSKYISSIIGRCLFIFVYMQQTALEKKHAYSGRL